MTDHDGTASSPNPSGTIAPARALGATDDIQPSDVGGLGYRLNHTLARRLPFRTATVALEAPILSITFDDFPQSSYMDGARILEDAGVRGTYYTASGLLGRQTSRWTVADCDAVVSLHERGHEIGLHSHSHRPANAMRAAEFAVDLAANRAALRRMVPPLTRENYAYPYGLCGLRQKRHLSRTVRSSRSVQPGINAGRMDLDFIRSVEISERSMTEANCDPWLDQTVEQRGWLVLFTHDVTDAPSPYGTTPAALTRIVARAIERGIAILPVASALDRMGID